MTLPFSIVVIRDGQRVLTSLPEPTDLFPGFGATDPVTHADTDGTFEEFVAVYGRTHTI